ncbi:MAG TPA: formyltransferase family protein, partial [Blastocatellia bacterium]|nr:formyltransferase family protein [Blastocatellia bacterium]
YSLREKIKRSIRYDGYPATAWKLARKLVGSGEMASNGVGAMEDNRERLRKTADSLGIPFHLVSNYHTEESISMIRDARPDLGVVFGTNILKESVFKIPRLGSINLHQGLTPYYRGGPSVFWELFNGEKQAGLTVHFVETKVDSGEIILQDTVPLEYDYSYGLDFERFLRDFRAGNVDRCTRLVADAVQMIAEGRANPRQQDLSIGRRYRLPTKKEKDEMRRLLRRRRREAMRQPVMQKMEGRS